MPAAAPAASTPVSRSITLGAALEAAWQRAVAARESEAQRGRAAAERAVTGSWWPAPPALELSHRSERWPRNDGQRETELGLAVPLWLPGQRAARSGAADALVAQAAAADRVARWRLAGELREAAAGIAAAQAEAAQAAGQAQALRRLADDVERRVRAGDLARADALGAQAEWLAALAQVAEAEQRQQALRMRWKVLTGSDAVPEPAPSGADPKADAALPPHPELELAGQTTALARRRVELLRVSRRDPFEVNVGVRNDMPGRAQPSSTSVVVGLRVPFGNDVNNRPLEATALGELDVAQTQEQRLRDRIEADVASARAALSSARTQLDAEQARARLLNERALLIDRSFRAGESPLPELLRALAAAALADAGALRQTAALGLAQARLQQALGVLP